MARLRGALHVRPALKPVPSLARRLFRMPWLAALALAVCLAAPPAADAGGVAGRFDFYVLALSWSPSYCAAAGARANRRECGGGARYGFVVHGLWPQTGRGHPRACPSRFSSRVPAELGRKYFDIMPGMGLIGHEWRAHGTCTGLDQAAYFRLVRKARETVRVPSGFAAPAPARVIDPDRLEAAFLAANPGMPRDGIAVTCREGRVEDVRICLTRALDFRSCPAVDAASCRRPRVVMPKAGNAG